MKSNLPTYKTVSIDTLIPYARNSRTHSESQIDYIANSIKEFGFLDPVIIDKANGIMAGHGRVLAAKKLGMTDIPVIEAKHLSSKQRKAYIIADNNIALLAGWDTSILLDELSLIAEDYDLSLIGFDDNAINELMTLQDYSPSLDPATNYQEITQNQIDKTQIRLENAFTDKAEQNLHNVICPNCAVEFYISKA